MVSCGNKTCYIRDRKYNWHNKNPEFRGKTKQCICVLMCVANRKYVNFC